MKLATGLLLFLTVLVGYGQNSKNDVKAEIQAKTLALFLEIETDAIDDVQDAFETYYAAGFDSDTNLRTVEQENKIAFLNAQLKLANTLYQNMPPEAFQEWRDLRNEQLRNKLEIESNIEKIYSDKAYQKIQEAQRKYLPFNLKAY